MSEGEKMLLCRVHGRRCALPLEHVVETMRPLPISPLAGAPAGVSGLAVIRGAPVPVVDLSCLFSSDEGYNEVAPTRFVTVRVGQRLVALAVDLVEGVSALSDDALQTLPPLLGEVNSESISAIGSLDAELLLVLRSASLLPVFPESLS